jgi:hypothetical protein
MTLQELVDGVKRDSQNGVFGDNTDSPASDILRQFTLASSEFWEFDDWEWSKTDISVSLAQGTSTAQSLAAAVGRIIVLGIQGQEGDLEILSERQYRRNKKPDVATEGSVWAAVMRGRDSSGNLKVLFVDTPSDAVVIEGQGKTRLSAYAVSDISTLGTIPYFPVEVHPLLYDWTLGRYLITIKDARGGPLLEDARQRVKKLIGRAKTEPANQIITPPPSYVKFVQNKRGGRTVV